MRLHLAHNRSPLSTVEASPPWPVLHTCSIGGNVGTSLGLPSPMIWPIQINLLGPWQFNYSTIFFVPAGFVCICYWRSSSAASPLSLLAIQPTSSLQFSIDYFHLLFTASCRVLSNFQHQGPFTDFFPPPGRWFRHVEWSASNGRRPFFLLASYSNDSKPI